jgi:hypothetical protein
VEYLQYYEGLTKEELAHNDNWLIVIIEAAWYCDSNQEKYIRYNALKERCNKALNRITEGERSLGSGALASILKSRRCKRFLRIVKVNKNEKRIYPNIPLIQKVVKARQTENYDAPPGARKVTRFIPKIDKVDRARSLPIESVSISDGLSMSVTRASEKKEKEKEKNS